MILIIHDVAAKDMLRLLSEITLLLLTSKMLKLLVDKQMSITRICLLISLITLSGLTCVSMHKMMIF